jgi:outer membrane protein OmpA-like peptidoglycan-associated protein
VLAPGSVTFARASAELNLRSHSTLDQLANVIGKCSDVEFVIAGHADAEGTPESKQRLSQRRAQAVFDYLSNAGIDTRRMSTVGYADTQPLAANDTEQNRAKNRRISIDVKVN